MSATLTLSPSADLFLSPQPFALEHDHELPALELAYELFGATARDARQDSSACRDAPLFLIQGGISAHPHVASSRRDPSPGWWSAQVGEGRAIDTRAVRVLSLEFLGKRHERVVSSGDQARATALLLDQLGIARVDAFVGASYGGMVALRFAELFPERVGQIVAISAPDRSRTFATAWRALQRELLDFGARQDPASARTGFANRWAQLRESPACLASRAAVCVNSQLVIEITNGYLIREHLVTTCRP